MPRTNIPVTLIPSFSGGVGGAVTLTTVAADATNDHEMINDGRTFLLFQNTVAGATSATIVSVPDEYGRLGDITVTIPTYNSATQNSVTVAGPFRQQHWNQGNGTKMNVDLAGAVTTFLSAFRTLPL